MGKRLLDDKTVLIVDDEPDILELLEELLSMCQVLKASNFEDAKEILENQYLDLAVLDIMGVDGYKLLEIANQRKVIAVMLTAHALTPENIVKSFNKGAASYLPKNEIANIAALLEEILEDKRQGKHFWSRWMERWGDFYDKKFGPNWREQDKEFWERFKYWI